MLEKYIIWDSVKGQWFRPTYPGHFPGKNNQQVYQTTTEEIFFSQSGEIYLRNSDGKDGQNQLIHYPVVQKGDKLEGRFIACLYTFFKDGKDNKLYQGDRIRDLHTEWIIRFDYLNGGWCVYDEKYPTENFDLKLIIGPQVTRIGNILELDHGKAHTNK